MTQKFIGNTQYDHEGALIRRAARVLRVAAREPERVDAPQSVKDRAREVALSILKQEPAPKRGVL